MATVKAQWELAVMRDNGRRLVEVALLMLEHVVPGATPLDLDALAEDKIRRLGAHPSFKGYIAASAPPFPATICLSVNEQIIHGIPDGRPFQAGDVVSVDLGLHHGGYHVDMAFTDVVGAASATVRALLDVTLQSLYTGISRARSGGWVGDIGNAIESTIKPHGLGIVQQYVGHGIGRALHERPSVPNYGKARTGNLLRPGMCLAIEPMVTLGSGRTRVLEDKWTVVASDGALAAHFEHTVAITPQGPEVLTAMPHEVIPQSPLI